MYGKWPKSCHVTWSMHTAWHCVDINATCTWHASRLMHVFTRLMHVTSMIHAQKLSGVVYKMICKHSCMSMPTTVDSSACMTSGNLHKLICICIMLLTTFTCTWHDVVTHLWCHSTWINAVSQITMTGKWCHIYPKAINFQTNTTTTCTASYM